MTHWLYIIPLFLLAFAGTSLLADWLCRRITGRAIIWRRARSVSVTTADKAPPPRPHD